MTKKIVFIFCCFLFGQLFSQNYKLKQAELTFRTQIIDFDTIAFNRPVTCFFNFKNTGNADLKIFKTSTNCSCVQIALEKNIVKRNGTGKVKIDRPILGRSLIYDNFLLISILTNNFDYHQLLQKTFILRKY
jgi:hypothetical protein